MPHNKSYPVNNQVNLPQPQVPVPDQKRIFLCSSWIPFVTAGILSVLFLVGIYQYGGPQIFPVTIDIHAGLIPIVKKGYLQVVPFTTELNDTRQNQFLIELPLKRSDQIKYVNSLDQLFKGYPAKHDHPYKNCWLEKPSRDHPCFYDSSWIFDTCSKNNSYGYDFSKGEYSPCFILKFQNTEDWIPWTPNYQSLQNPTSGYNSYHFDQGFIPVVCVAKDGVKRSSTVDVDIYPPKGFSLLYFPQSYFNTSSYLSPLVAVKVKGIRRNVNVTVACTVMTPNAFMLWNSGKIRVTFSTL